MGSVGNVGSVGSVKVNLDLTGKRALVCGASAGIGRASALLLAAHGAEVILLARSEDKLTEVRSTLATSPKRAHQILVADQNDHANLSAKITDELKARGPIEILVNNSSGPRGGPIVEAPASEFTAIFHQHLLTNHLLAQALIPGMRERAYGRIVNVISTSVRVPIPGLGVSNTIRGAVASWAKTLSLEVGPFGITVNSVLPGYTRTERLTGLLKVESERSKRTQDEIADEWKKVVPLRRFAEPEEVAAAIVFLASPAASYVSGMTLPVDGGRTPSI